MRKWRPLSEPSRRAATFRCSWNCPGFPRRGPCTSAPPADASPSTSSASWTRYTSAPPVSFLRWRQQSPTSPPRGPSDVVTFHELVRDQAECFLFQYSVLEALGRRIPVINPPLAQEIHRTKVHQLFSLMQAGFPVPATVAGNDPEACRRFVATQGGERQVVVKPLAGIYRTALLGDRDLEASLAHGPVILQRHVQGDTIRAYIVGGRLVGAGKILHAGRAVDSSLEQAGVEPVELPASVAGIGRAAARHLGLAWTGVDFMRDTRTGDYFILECNASAMFAGFSAMTGFDVAGALADYLAELALRARASGGVFFADGVAGGHVEDTPARILFADGVPGGHGGCATGRAAPALTVPPDPLPPVASSSPIA